MENCAEQTGIAHVLLTRRYPGNKFLTFLLIEGETDMASPRPL
jgi:hypothetical protein